MNKKTYSDKLITRHNNPGSLNNFLPAFLVNDLNPNDLNITNFSSTSEYLDTSITSKYVNFNNCRVLRSQINQGHSLRLT
jgi:hypothetical protein